MSQNLTPRPYRFIIGTEDWSDGLVAFDGADTKINYTDGLVVFRGKATIGRPLGFATLDDRKNPLFNRGTPVIVEFRDNFNTLRRSPRGGYLFILSSSYDFNARLNTIELGDAFALLSVAEGKGDKTGVCLGVGESRRSIINKLLTAAGSPLLVDEIPGILSVPLPKLLEGSYIQQAGQIAASAGYFLYVDSQNQVRAKRLNPDATIAPITIDLSSGATEIKRLTGESPAQYVFARMQVTFARDMASGTVFESETFGPAAIAGIASSSRIVIRREKRTEKLVENRREVSSLVYEPAGAVIKSLSGDAGLIVSTETQEIYHYETDSQVQANPLAAKCETGNQARLLKRELNVWRPAGAILVRVIASLPPNASISKVPLILDTYEIETYNYDKPSDVIIPDRPVYDQYEDIAPQSAKLYGLTHTLERSESRGKVSPEDYLYEPNNNAWTNAHVVTPFPSYYVNRKWVEQRLNEWVATEENGDAFARAYSEDANALRQKFKSGNFIYSRETFTAAILVTKTTTISSNGNTQPPSPDTMPSKVSVDTATITGKASFPIDSSYQFRPRPLDITFNYVDIPGSDKAAVDTIRAKANELAAIWGKVAWGRFKGISCSTEFSQQWWDYSPLDRINIVETTPGIDYSEADTSAYLGDGFAIAITKQECFIGFDGIYLGFLKSNQINPPYRQVFINDLQLGFQVSYKTINIETPLAPILSSYSIQLGIQSQYLTALLSPTNVVSTGSSAEPYNLAVSWTATELSSGQTIAFYEIEYKNNDTTNVYQSLKQSSSTTTIFTGLTVGSFRARVRTVDASGRRSPWAESNDTEIRQIVIFPTVSIPMDIVLDLPVISELPTAIVQSYTITAFTENTTQYDPGLPPGVFFPLTWASLNDADRDPTDDYADRTGVAIGSKTGNPTLKPSLTFDFVSILSIKNITIAAGALGSPFSSLASNWLPDARIERSTDGTNWVTVLLAIPSLFAEDIQVQVEGQARYIRVTSAYSALAMTSFIVTQYTSGTQSSVLPPVSISMDIVLDLPVTSQALAPSTAIVSSYAVTASTLSTYFESGMASPGIWISPTYAILNDNNFSTGPAIDTSTASTVTVDLGSTININHIQLSGSSFIGSPWNDSSYLSGAILEQSVNGTTYTTIATVSSHLLSSTYTTFNVNASTRYIRVRRNGYLAFSNLIIHRFI